MQARRVRKVPRAPRAPKGLEGEPGPAGPAGSAVLGVDGTQLRSCAGSTPYGNTNFQSYGGNDLYVDVDTSGCGFTSTPLYITNLHGDGANYTVVGGSSAYARTATGFRLYLHSTQGISLTPAIANSFGWHVVWLAMGQ